MTEAQGARPQSPVDPEPTYLVGRSPRNWLVRSPSLQRLYWDLHSRWWDDVADRYGPDELAVREWLALVGRDPSPRVLDIGCGTGSHAAWLVARGSNVVGVDISMGMLRRARSKARTRDTGRAVFLRADLNDPLPVADASFDTVLCLAVMSAVTDVPRLLRDVHRVLRPRGRLIVRVIRFSRNTPHRGTMSGLLFSVGKALPGWQQRLGVRTRGELLDLLGEAGFRVMEERAASSMLTLLVEKRTIAAPA